MRVEIDLQQTEGRDSDELTGNYTLYLSVAERASFTRASALPHLNESTDAGFDTATTIV